MKIIIDSREQMPFNFSAFECEVVAETLPTGDYSLAGLMDRCAVERKSLDDLLGCLMGSGRERFERELARATGLECFAVVVEASMQDMAEGRYRSKMKPHAAPQSVLAFQVRHGCPSSGAAPGPGQSTRPFTSCVTTCGKHPPDTRASLRPTGRKRHRRYRHDEM